MFDEIEKQFATEFDYRKEAENLCKIHDNVMKGGFGREIVVPRPLWEYTTKVGSNLPYLLQALRAAAFHISLTK